MKFLSLLMAASLSVNLAACSPDDTNTNIETPEGGTGAEGGDNTDMKIRITAGGAVFTVTLYDNDSARAFMELLPMTVSMNELNGNEKYYYLPSNLPTAASAPGTINNGDLMLYGSNCIVVFYKTFSTGYSYTPLGKTDDPAGLAEALGTGSVRVTFEAYGED